MGLGTLPLSLRPFSADPSALLAALVHPSSWASVVAVKVSSGGWNVSWRAAQPVLCPPRLLISVSWDRDYA